MDKAKALLVSEFMPARTLGGVDIPAQIRLSGLTFGIVKCHATAEDMIFLQFG